MRNKVILFERRLMKLFSHASKHGTVEDTIWYDIRYNLTLYDEIVSLFKEILEKK